jgi:hypothetical protein
MKSKLILIAFFVISYSCTKKVTPTEPKRTTILSPKIEKVGADRDEHGCIPSAGYTWSVLKKECVRTFEVGTRLNSIEDDSTSAIVIFDEEGNKAELFTSLLKSPIILVRKEEGQSWINGDWELISWKGYALKKDGKVLFHGQ